ncbi:Phosphotransferase enzyme [Tulasnella sp. JGI-2019a]|nr:Phosphotransferase enzyme [Tulasnella sp. JGI-2019a]
MEKVAEGAFAKIFLLTFDNSKSLIARIPSTRGGPPHFTTASEVATMEYAREILEIPVPKVLAWSSRASSTAVAAEFILMELVEGVTVDQRTETLEVPTEAKALMEDVVDLHSKFLQAPLSQIGSIYYKEDVPEALRDRPFYADGYDGDERASQRFRVGPMVTREFWSADKASLDVDRGPWPDMQSYLIAIARSQQAWLRNCVVRRPEGDPFRRSDAEDSIEAHCAILDIFVKMVPYVTPHDYILTSPIMWHPDLNPRNIMAREALPYGISGILDWQNTRVAPVILQCEFPSSFTFRYNYIDYPLGSDIPSRPTEYNTLPLTQKKAVHQELLGGKLQKGIELSLNEKVPYQLTMESPLRKVLVELMDEVVDTWFIGFPVFRETLRNLDRRLRKSFPEYDLPPAVAEEDLEEHQKMLAALEAYITAWVDLDEKLDMQGEGWVRANEYEERKKRLDEARAEWDSSKGPFPFQDGVWSRDFGC